MIYDQFISIEALRGCDFTWPITADAFTKDGNITKWVIFSWDHIPEATIALRVEKPNPLVQLEQEVRASLGTSSPTIGSVLHYLQRRSLLNLKVDDQPSKDWLDRKLDSLSITTPSRREAIRNWFMNPHEFPVAYHLTGNDILTVKQVGTTGRVIVCPQGHTLAYSMAKRIYLEMMGKPQDVAVPPVIRVFEYVGRSSYNRGRYITSSLTIKHSQVKIGCQIIPRQAIMDLAEREDW